MALTDYMEQQFMDDYFVGRTLYAALLTVPPSDSDPGTEIAGDDYNRGALNFIYDSSNQNQNVYNDALIDFGSVPASTVYSVGIYDAATGGNMLIYADLPAPVTFVEGDSVVADPQTFYFAVN